MARGYKAIWRDGKLVAEYEGGQLTSFDAEYWSRKHSDLAAPMVVRDIGEYKSVIDGTVISSRSAHRDHLRAHEVIEVGNERMPSPAPSAPNASREIGEAIKQRIDEVRALPEHVYQDQVQQQSAEHNAVAALVTAAA